MELDTAKRNAKHDAQVIGHKVGRFRKGLEPTYRIAYCEHCNAVLFVSYDHRLDGWRFDGGTSITKPCSNRPDVLD